MAYATITDAEFDARYARDRALRQEMLGDGPANPFTLREELDHALASLEEARFVVLQAHARLAAHDPFYAERRTHNGSFETWLTGMGQTVLAAQNFDYDAHPAAPKLVDDYGELCVELEEAIRGRRKWQRANSTPEAAVCARYDDGDLAGVIVANVRHPGWFWRVSGPDRRTLDSCIQVGRFHAGSAALACARVEEAISSYRSEAADELAGLGQDIDT